MAKLTLTKGALALERSQLKLYQKLLPSLDLKRRQLTVERDKAYRALSALEERVVELTKDVAERIPMLANMEVELADLVCVKSVTVTQLNIVGTKVPELERLEFDVAPYAFVSKPVWVDIAVDALKDGLTARVRLQLAQRRARLLENAVRRITQRVNLFERVLIPRAKKNIERIQIHLGDRERDGVVRSKLAKRRGQQARAVRTLARGEQ